MGNELCAPLLHAERQSSRTLKFAETNCCTLSESNSRVSAQVDRLNHAKQVPQVDSHRRSRIHEKKWGMVQLQLVSMCLTAQVSGGRPGGRRPWSPCFGLSGNLLQTRGCVSAWVPSIGSLFLCGLFRVCTGRSGLVSTCHGFGRRCGAGPQGGVLCAQMVVKRCCRASAQARQGTGLYPPEAADRDAPMFKALS